MPLSIPTRRCLLSFFAVAHPLSFNQVMRATAFIQRAYSHGRALTDLLQKVVVDMPTEKNRAVLHEVIQPNPTVLLYL